MAGDDYTTSAFGQRSGKAAREEFQENSSFCLAISQDQPSATKATITQISRKMRGYTQSATREGSHLARSQSRPSDAALEPFCCCCCCCCSKTSRKSRERRRGDNVSHSPRLNSRMHCLQYNSRLTSKKFSTSIERCARAA